MAEYRVKLTKKEEVAVGTFVFYFEKPSGFKFIAGQYLNLRLIDPLETDEEGNRRFFSIAAAPYEKGLMIATRMRDSAFKRTLKNMPVGEEVEIFGPSGNLILHQDTSQKAVLLAGGIGITPFRSMILQASFERLPHKIYLFYSNRRPEDSAFLQELEKIQKENPNYKFIGTMTEMTDSKRIWQGETDYITKQLLIKYLGSLDKAIFYTAGPPQMVEAMVKLLQEAGVNKDRVKSEDFTGY